jgi:dTDP-4-dehydrorhamnose 3,5-epimerase-like enzyme
MKLNSKLISTERGDLNELVFNEIEAKRIFVVTEVPEGLIRGYHAHKNTCQYLCCISGEIEITLDNGSNRNTYHLKKSDYIFQKKLIWSEIKFLNKKSILLVICSTKFNEEDYIRNYEDFKKIVVEKKL